MLGWELITTSGTLVHNKLVTWLTCGLKDTPIWCQITFVGTVQQIVTTFWLSRKIFHPCKRCFQWQTTARTSDVSNTNKRMQEQSNWTRVTIEWEEQSIWEHMHILHRGTACRLMDIMTYRQFVNTWEMSTYHRCVLCEHVALPALLWTDVLHTSASIHVLHSQIMCVLFVFGFRVSRYKHPMHSTLYCSHHRNHTCCY
jgi:hypothetical protein